MSKAHPNNGGTFTKGKRETPKRTFGDANPRLDPSKPRARLPKNVVNFFDEMSKDPAKLQQIARKATTGRP